MVTSLSDEIGFFSVISYLTWSLLCSTVKYRGALFRITQVMKIGQTGAF